MTDDTKYPEDEPRKHPRHTAYTEELVEISGHTVRPGIFQQKGNPANALKYGGRTNKDKQGKGKQHPASAAALKAYHIKPGEVRNPWGKPKGTIDLKHAIARILEMEGEVEGLVNPLKPGEVLGKRAALDLMIFVQLRKALNGNTESFRELVNRVDPLPAGNNVQVNINAHQSLTEEDRMILQHVESPYNSGNTIEGEVVE